MGPTEIDQQRFDSPESLLAWLVGPRKTPVFLKETVSRPVLDVVLAERRFLREARHSFLIRRPEEIAASFYALERDMRIEETGVRALFELYTAVVREQGHIPVVVDSDDLVNQPEATMRAYCAAVGLPFIADAMRWEAGVQPEWARTARWHEDASASTGFWQPVKSGRSPLASHPDVVRFVEAHQPYYENLRAQRIRIDDHIV